VCADPCAARDDERVVRDPVAAARDDAMLGALDAGEGAGDEPHVEVGGDRGERDGAGMGDREGLGDRHRAVVEIGFGSEQRDAHAVAGQLPQRHDGLKRRDPTARDEDLNGVRLRVDAHTRRD
jgi:hypothetical protein